jgi:hypothetical protein
MYEQEEKRHGHIHESGMQTEDKDAYEAKGIK